ncbi:CdaR family transcriptional regulator [Streptomyces sp. TLI_185]|uniref:PucR family transcriptional regulator n=1 Tax=Streptomyces sp. TLI_185 TaxID=2485151 RepID=UPI000FB6A34D|nr:helix-turn-helix domain-containing protein [Streptomyces sp. TLI_185]RPF31780.1 PucR-like helix-turn-helix protein [Streptomyces sp. TLI_185]
MNGPTQQSAGEAPDPVVLAAQVVQTNRDEFIAKLVATTEAEISQLEHDEPLHGLLEASITENIVTALHVIINRIDPLTVDAPASAISYARRLAQRDVPLSALLRAYRLGHAQSLDLVLGEAVRLGLPDPAGTVIALVQVTSAYLDRVCDQIGRAYEEERERWVGTRGVLRQYWVGQLLDNPRVDLRQAETALDYPLSGSHLAVECWRHGSEAATATDTVAVFDRLASLLHTVLRAQGRPLLVHTDEAHARIWLAVRPDCHVDPDTIAAELGDAALPVRAALGIVRPGLDGFRRSTRAAARTKALALSAGPGAPRVVAFARVAPVALLVDEPRELADFVSDSLGDLAVDDPRCELLRETLRLFLATNRSYAATAEELMVHRNTVHYRVQRAVDHYHLNLDADAFDLHFALTVCHWHGAKVLRRKPR